MCREPLGTVPFVRIGEHDIEYLWCGPPPTDAPTLVFLHEGLGSARAWRDFPAAICERSGRAGLVYSRWGCGGSDPIDRALDVRFMHQEALESLPQLLQQLGVERSILIGHSDGASIAIIYASEYPDVVDGLVLEAPHVFVEDVTVASISALRQAFDTSALEAKLIRHHGPNTRALFYAWTDVWLSPEFRRWNIQEQVAKLRCPVLAIQGTNDQYGTARQLHAIQAGLSKRSRSMVLSSCGHAPHMDQRTEVEDIVARFVIAETSASNVE